MYCAPTGHSLLRWQVVTLSTNYGTSIANARGSLQLAEQERENGVSLHTSPMAGFFASNCRY